MGWIWWIIIGAVAGWLAGLLMRGDGFGFIVNLLVGIAGAVIGGWVFGLLGIAAGGVIGSLITALIGAIILLWIISLFRRRRV
ncbi:MAG: GlsB/YeaQ/YmgE family stress response membrane protein [Bacteroidales bacterium]|nr:GlsB/YeaQ/YmgE family stress response membrane protein [Bacteroidales bacterium]